MTYPPPPPSPDGDDEDPSRGYPPGQYGYPPPPDQHGAQYGGGYGAPPGAAGTNTKALWALVVGIVGLPLAVCCSVVGLVGIAAILLGRSARREIAESGGAQGGEGMARAGYVLGWVDVALAVVLIIVGIILRATGHSYFYYDPPNG